MTKTKIIATLGPTSRKLGKIRMKKILLIVMIILVLGCHENRKEKDIPRMWTIYGAQKLSGFVNHSTVYPYHASKEREKFLRDIFPQVQKAKTVDEVIRLLGSPDEKERSYATENPGEQRHIYYYSYYILKIKKLPNNFNEIMGICFDDNGNIINGYLHQSGADIWLREPPVRH